MSDITMCVNTACPLNMECYRYRAIANDWQSICEFKPNEDGSCDNHWPLEPGMRLEEKPQ